MIYVVIYLNLPSTVIKRPLLVKVAGFRLSADSAHFIALCYFGDTLRLMCQLIKDRSHSLFQQRHFLPLKHTYNRNVSKRPAIL